MTATITATTAFALVEAVDLAVGDLVVMVKETVATAPLPGMLFTPRDQLWALPVRSVEHFAETLPEDEVLRTRVGVAFEVDGNVSHLDMSGTQLLAVIQAPDA